MRIKSMKFMIFALSLSIFSLTSAAFADKVSPPRIYLTVPRGKTETAVLFLRGTTFNEKVLLYLTDIMIDRRGNYQFEKLEDWKYCARDWLKLYKVTKLEEKTPEGKVKIRIIASLYKEREVLTLKTDRDTFIGIKVKAPFNIKPGQYYAGIMVEPTEFRVLRGVIEGKAVAVRKITRIAVPIIITVPGRVPRLNGKVISAGADIRKEEVKILATFENTSGVIEFVKGKAQIVNKEDKRVYDVVTMKALNPISPDGTGEIYPESLRDYEGIVKGPLPAGEYEIRIAFDYGLKTRKARARASFTVTEEIAAVQKELLTLNVEPELLEYELKPGGMVMGRLEVINQDFQDLHVDICIQKGVKWLQIVKKLDLRGSQPGRLVSKTIRYRIRIPRGEKVERSTKILFKPERGKPVVVDVIVKKKRETKR